MTELTQDIAVKIAETAIEEYERRHEVRLKRDKDNQLFNIGKLMRLYPILKINAESKLKNYIQNDEYEKLIGKKIEEHPLMISNAKTKNIMRYVDHQLNRYHDYCMDGDERDQRRWKIVECTYLANNRLNSKKIEEKLHVSQGTVSREKMIALETLSAMMFGIVGLSELLDMYPD